MRSNFYSLSLDARIQIDTEIYKEIRAKKNGKYSRQYPDRRTTLDEIVKNGYQLEVTD